MDFVHHQANNNLKFFGNKEDELVSIKGGKCNFVIFTMYLVMNLGFTTY